VADLGLEALVVLILLLPGFLAARVVQSLCVRTKQTDLDKIVEALIYTFLVYVIFFQFSSALPFTVEHAEAAHSSSRSEPAGTGYLRLPIGKESDAYTLSWNGRGLLLLAAVSLALALLISFVTNNDSILTLLRKLRFTQQTSRSSVWNDVLYTLPSDAYVSVELNDGRLIMGYLKHYSPKPEESMLFLSEATWVSATARTPIDGPGILLTKASGVKNLMFLTGTRRTTTATAHKPISPKP
jgi:hypothetical protein